MRITFNKIFFVIFLIALGGLSWYTYKILERQYFTNPSSSQTSQQNKSSSAPAAAPNISTNSDPVENPNAAPPSKTNGPSSPDNSSSAPISINDRNPGPGSMLAHITTEHCATNCQAFASDLSLLEYCQEVCGIIPVKNVSNCDGKIGIEKDYCLKDLAITKKDSSVCGQISDVNIKQTCQNRIAQDLIENQ